MTYTAATITISGLGLTFDDILITVQRALMNTGYEVMITNDHPYTPGSEDTIMTQCKDRSYPVHVIAKHLPWGG